MPGEVIISRMPLDPEIAAYLEAQKSLPPRAGLTFEETRARMVESGRQYGGEAFDIPRTENFTLPGGVRVREYRGAGWSTFTEDGSSAATWTHMIVSAAGWL